MKQPTLIDTAPQNRHAAKLKMQAAIQAGMDHMAGLGPYPCEEDLVPLLNQSFGDLLEALDATYPGETETHVEYGVEIHEDGKTGPRIVILRTQDLAQAEENLRAMVADPDMWRDPKLVTSTVVRSAWGDAASGEEVA